MKNARPAAIEQAATRVRESFDAGLFHDFLGPDVVLVPTPGSARRRPGALWTPERICTALVKHGLGERVLPCLHRHTAVPKSAVSAPKDRPKAQRHFETIGAADPELGVERLTIVDDVVTRGATLLGAANRLALSYPNAEIRAFALLRAISDGEITKFRDPQEGVITINRYGNTKRRP